MVYLKSIKLHYQYHHFARAERNTRYMTLIC